ncbi:hypothetical protein V498_01689 [Pseudogymnoascus sp. VKM F-4517 (FW-2822)]|nr:hypothetical protein V498_01689 [Pseudogymnoascus sp. VKM F-4517 (FW-2822)]
MRLPSLLALAISLPAATALIGHGVEMYNPTCAFACRAVIASAKLTCSGHEGHTTGMSHGATTTTTPECRAGDTAFLTTLAWCMDSMCAPFSMEAWRLEKYWEERTTGLLGVVPKWTYAKTLQEIVVLPEAEFDKNAVLNGTVVVPRISWDAQMNTLGNFEAMETNHSKYAICNTNHIHASRPPPVHDEPARQDQAVRCVSHRRRQVSHPAAALPPWERAYHRPQPVHLLPTLAQRRLRLRRLHL